jgi:hypothetical protein
MTTIRKVQRTRCLRTDCQAAQDDTDRLRALNAELVAALKRSIRLFDEALPKFDWGRSALDANAIKLLNEVPGEARAALAKAKGPR